MRLLQFYKMGRFALALRQKKGIIDVAEEAKKSRTYVPQTMLALAASGKGALDVLKNLRQVQPLSSRTLLMRRL